MRMFLAVVLAGVFLVSNVRAEMKSDAETCEAITGGRWKQPAWHLVDMWYDLGDSQPFKSLTIEVEVDGDVTEPGRDKLIYIAPVYGKINGSGFYFGMQTDVSRPGGAKRGFIFSRWGRASSEDAAPAEGGWSAALTHAQSNEGDFAGVRVAYPWKAGRYLFRMEPTMSDGGGTWVALVVGEYDSGKVIEVGSVRFPGQDLTIDKDAVSFVEIYGHEVIDNICRTRMPSTGVAVFRQLEVNERAIDLRRRSSCVFPRDVPPLAAVSRSPDDVIVEFGRAPWGERCK
ncbi:conserved protein of unknown function [Magnetospirillum gryphiswaldense MSR-1 v2]|uniref:Secreted protein n=1 Tax=Magnetospirillum gryphiswaldense (strain DSM 6361 / JCM 21280 / NBRC 15271 / MSR-1) TaxID=431944 RepID=V6F657_MAGGM|nr:hypothetical protein [Magnetospirillum gryphiswaldense]CDL01015.1 conserved protein of unknown function [Magnetospirillum gryphiswaldense MSR-1 v2]